MKQPKYYLYIMTNRRNTVLYKGVTNDLARRVHEHRQRLVSGFSNHYRTSKLVYYEVFEDAENANQRERQIKGGSRRKKVELIELANASWRDLFGEVVGETD